MPESFDPAVYGKKRYLAAVGSERAADNRGVASGRKTLKWENKSKEQSLLQRGKRRRKQMEGKKEPCCGFLVVVEVWELGGKGGWGLIVEVICLICCFWSEECWDWEHLISSACSERCKYYGTSVVTLKRRHWFGRRARWRGLVGRLRFSCTERPVAPFGCSVSCGRSWEKEGRAPVWILGY